MNKIRRNVGFTFVECMIIICIIAMLLALAIPGFIKVREKALFQKKISQGVTDENVVKITRVFMKNTGEYACMMKKGKELIPFDVNGKSFVIFGKSRNVENVTVFCDATEEMYITFTVLASGEACATIHVFSEKDIGGAGWVEKTDDKNIQHQTNVLR